jgi:alpha-galactosidase
MGSHIGAAAAHSTGRSQPMELRAGVAATGHFGLELDIRRLDPNERLSTQSWIEFYKQRRHLIHGGDVWLGESGDGVQWQAHGSPSDFLLFVFRLEPTAERYAPSAKAYHVSIEQGWQRRGWMTGGAFFADIEGGGLEIAGAWLKDAGLALPPMLAESCAVFRIRAL